VALVEFSEPSGGGHRYQDLHDAPDGIAHKVLTETLRRAERDGLVTRHLDAEHIETATLYELTDLDRSLDEPLTAFDHLVEVNWERVEATLRQWDRRAGRASHTVSPGGDGEPRCGNIHGRRVSLRGAQGRATRSAAGG
jgi:DNA-binding HxlR family transcriptional regulator